MYCIMYFNVILVYMAQDPCRMRHNSPVTSTQFVLDILS